MHPSSGWGLQSTNKCSILAGMRAGALPDDDAARPEADGDLSGPRDRAAKLASLELVRPGITTAATLAHERTLPVTDGLSSLVPRGALQRGSTIAAHGPGATSFSLALVAEAARQGSFLAVVAPRSFALASCLDFAIPLRRVVQFVLPDRAGDAGGDSGGAGWAQLVAAVIEGFDLIVVADRRRVTASQARQLTNRVRERGTVLVRAGGPAWADGADLRYDLREPAWQGLGAGHGHLQSRIVQVQAAGRRWHGADRVRHVALPGPGDQGVTVLARPQAPDRVTPLRRLEAPGQTAAGDGIRHAGSDIDHLLQAVDGTSQGDGADGAEGSAEAEGSAGGATAFGVA